MYILWSSVNSYLMLLSSAMASFHIEMKWKKSNFAIQSLISQALIALSLSSIQPKQSGI